MLHHFSKSIKKFHIVFNKESLVLSACFQFGIYCDSIRQILLTKKPVSSKKTGSLKSCSLCFMIYRSKSTPTPNTRLVRVKSSAHLA